MLVSGTIVDMHGIQLGVHASRHSGGSGHQILGLWTSADANGDSLAFYQLDCLIPRFCAVVPCLGSGLSVDLWNNDSSSHNVASLTCIPLAQMPAEPHLLIPTAFGNDPATSSPTSPSAPVIVSAASQNVGANASVTLGGNFVWPGKALLNFYTGQTTYTVTVQTVDAAGTATFVDKFGATANGVQRTYTLPPGTPQVIITNTSGSAFQPSVSLIATS